MPYILHVKPTHFKVYSFRPVFPVFRLFQLVMAFISCVCSRAQDIEPRLYANAPVGMNFAIGGFAYTNLGLPQDPALPLTDPNLNTANAVVAYARVLDLWGCSAKLSAQAPYAFLKGNALFNDVPVSREVDGLTDARVRLAVNLMGAPALSLKDFSTYRQDLVIGASISVIAPTGQYDRDRIVNIGANRWSMIGEVGASKAAGEWILELSTALQVFTTNAEFYGGTTRAQQPVYSVKGHVIRNFPKGLWASADATYYTGGASTLGTGEVTEFQSNWRVGATLAVPVSLHHSFKLYASSGVYTRTGNNFDMVGMVWQYRWGGRP